MSKLQRMYFPTEDIKISVVMKRDDILQEIEQMSQDVVPKKVLETYGKILMPAPPEDRPYTFGSIVLSSDGKMAYPDDPQGPLIAGKNFLDKEGGKADFWVLNMLRAYSDATIIGAKTLQAEPKGTSHVFCQEMAEARVKEMGKKTDCPWNVIVSFDGTDIPLDHMIFETDEIEVRIGTSPIGAEYLRKHLTKPHLIFGPYKDITEVDIDYIATKINEQKSAIPIFATGEGVNTDSKVLLYILRKLGIEKLCIESPSYMFHLLENEAMDEMFINYSAVFVGGNITMGSYKSFSVDDHPHADIIMLGHHRSNFIFTRQKIRYGITE